MGILLRLSVDNVVENNIFYNNNEGINCQGSERNRFSRNLFFNNVEYAIRITIDSNDNNVQFNDFTGNNPGHQQAADDGSNNLFSNNYWSDWTGTGSYAVASDTGNQDLSPLTNPYHLPAPVFTAPTAETLTLKDIVTLQWNASSDSFGHSLTYSVFYSTDDGTTWLELASGLATTKYTWDLATIDNGTKVLLKVQVTDSVGFHSFSISPSTFTIDKPALTTAPTTTTTTTTTTMTTTTTTTIVSSWNFFLLIFSLLVMLPLRQRRRKS